MTKWYLPGAVLTALILAVFGVAASGAFDSDPADGTRDAVADEAKCAADATDCQEPGADGGTFGICIAESDPNYNPDEPCNDMGGDDGSAAGSTCLIGTPDCNDADLGNDSTSNMCVAGATDCDDTADVGVDCYANPDDEECQRLATEGAFADLEQRIPGQEITIVSFEVTEWSDSSLGNPKDGESYLQVITPGYKVVFEVGGQQYEYHTDTAGNFTAIN